MQFWAPGFGLAYPWLLWPLEGQICRSKILSLFLIRPFRLINKSLYTHINPYVGKIPTYTYTKPYMYMCMSMCVYPHLPRKNTWSPQNGYMETKQSVMLVNTSRLFPRMHISTPGPHKNPWAFIPQDGRAAQDTELVWSNKQPLSSPLMRCAAFHHCLPVLLPTRLHYNNFSHSNSTTTEKHHSCSTSSGQPMAEALLDDSNDDPALLPASLHNTFLVNEFSMTSFLPNYLSGLSCPCC